MKCKYVKLSRPLEIKTFEIYEAPRGWTRIDILLRKLKDNKFFRTTFTKDELHLIKKEGRQPQRRKGK